MTHQVLLLAEHFMNRNRLTTESSRRCCCFRATLLGLPGAILRMHISFPPGYGTRNTTEWASRCPNGHLNFLDLASEIGGYSLCNPFPKRAVRLGGT